ncbi:hypothetical protein GCK72_022603 [Caenorhabditis remanei]|uniref:Protein kinase domain-containing protein n=1 Tax=Caenorhabditis remanei TaxID=31234 RepID=A0A6A5FU50_CAERE|nr:hypothetical protein GCK72_022603 [Caenorhabditis remanei]KAF1746150.1 hypothetical protein GCK72_022603 [Caenorhabditis remanei]
MMIADTSINYFADFFVTVRDRNKGRRAAKNNDKRLKRMVKDHQRHHDMQEESEHVKTEMIAAGKSVRLSDFIKKGLIGQGSYGMVYEYESKRSGQSFAIKVGPNWSCVKSAQFEIEREELRVHSTLHNKNVVKLLTSFKTAANVYMILEKWIALFEIFLIKT